MTNVLRPALMIAGLGVMGVVPASAQSGTDRTFEIGPAETAGALGASGLWLVPRAETLPSGVTTFGLQHIREAVGDTTTSSVGVTAARGVGSRTEVFGMWQTAARTAGHRGYGDSVVGARVNLLSQYRDAPVALALQSAVKVPTGDDGAGTSTGQFDLAAELVGSRQFTERVELAGTLGYVWRGDTDEAVVADGARAGVGVGVMVARSLRVFAEISGARSGEPGPGTRLMPRFDPAPAAVTGAAWRFDNGLTVGGGLTRAIGGPTGGDLGVVARVGYRPLSRRPAPVVRAVASPAPPTPPSAPPALGSAAPPPPASAAASPASAAPDEVFFDLDQVALRSDALAVLDQQVARLRSNPSLRLLIEGHACEIGTSEYNIALSVRRADVVRDYLVGRGIAANRFNTVGYGEERPKYDNNAEPTRALNRRAALVVAAE